MPHPNQRIGEYILIGLIGQGAFGEVWKAHHHAWADQIVAIKIPTDPQFLRSFQGEGNAIHRLSRPNIVEATNFDPYNDPPYLVMEYVPGTNLRALIQRGAMPPADAVAVMTQVLDALDHAHKNGVVHRDIKPENILIHESAARSGFATGTVKLTDFGSGQAAPQNQNTMVFTQDREAGRIVGSQQYMAPEQMDGGQVDGRADLYSCGVVLFEMLTGQRPAGMELPSEVNPAVPAALDEVFRHAFTRLERRFASAEEFSIALKQAMVKPSPIRLTGEPRFSTPEYPLAAASRIATEQRREPPAPDAGKKLVLMGVATVVVVVLLGILVGYLANATAAKHSTTRIYQPAMPPPPIVEPAEVHPIPPEVRPDDPRIQQAIDRMNKSWTTPRLPNVEAEVPQSEDKLLARLRSSDPAARRAAAAALQSRGWQPQNDTDRAWLLVAQANPLEAAQYADAAVQPLCLLLTEDGDVSSTAAQCLGRLLDIRATKPLCQALAESKNVQTRLTAAVALGKIRDPSSLVVLRRVLAKEPADGMGQEIAEAIRKVSDKSEPDRLVAALKDDDWEVQLRAATLLLTKPNDDARAAAWMEHVISKVTDNGFRCEKSIQTLGRIGSPTAIRILIADVGRKGYDPDAIDELVRLGEPVIPPMLAAIADLKPDTTGQNARHAMFRALADLGEPAMPALTSFLTKSDTKLKRTACEAFRYLHMDTHNGLSNRTQKPGTHLPIEPLVALLSDADADVRASAAEALETLKWEPAHVSEQEAYDKARRR